MSYPPGDDTHMPIHMQSKATVGARRLLLVTEAATMWASARATWPASSAAEFGHHVKQWQGARTRPTY